MHGDEDDGSLDVARVQVRGTANRRHVERILDDGSLDKASLRVSRDDRTVSWVRDGERRTVRVRTR